MVTSIRLTIALFFILCFISTAFGRSCGVKNLVIEAVKSGRLIKGEPEWNVQIVNKCNCSLSKIVPTCTYFQTVEAVDPSIFRKAGTLCYVNGGRPLRPQAVIKFSYALDPPAVLFPFSAVSVC